MADYHPQTFRGLDEDATVRAILEGTATATGERFFAALVENLSSVLDTYSSWVTEYIEKTRQLRVLAFWADGIIDSVFRELDNHARGLKQADDITLVVIKIEDPPGTDTDWQI